MFKSLLTKQIRSVTTQAETISHIATPPKYVLASIRSFPSLEPHSIVPISAAFLNAPLRRDILWRAIVQEADNSRVGSSNPPTRSTNGYSRHKLRPQKGSGKARVGDGNSPTRVGGAIAHGRRAPNDYTTDLPKKIYSLAVRTALSQQYRLGKIFIIGGTEKSHETESNILDFNTDSSIATKEFIKHHDVKDLNLLFILNEPRQNLFDSSAKFADRVDIVTKVEVEVRDILTANRIYIEEEALKYLMDTYSKE